VVELTDNLFERRICRKRIFVSTKISKFPFQPAWNAQFALRGRVTPSPTAEYPTADHHRPPLFLPPVSETAPEFQFFDEKEKVFLIAPNASASSRGTPGRWISMITQSRPAFSVMA
jgi:hypothetical protein